MNDRLKHVSSRHRQKNLNFYKWTSIFFLSLTLISGSVLTVQWWEKKQRIKAHLEQIKQEVQKYELQQDHLISTLKLSQSPQVKKFFTDLLRNIAEKFAKAQNLDIRKHSLFFGGFFLDEKISKGQGTMGHAFYRFLVDPTDKTTEISLNQLYLLNKFGHNQYLATSPQLGKYYCLKIDFNKMVKTCCHELAHYLQFVKHGKSSCQSDLKLNNGKYNPLLAGEHKQFSKEIFQMIKNSDEYKEWERRWNYIQ